jgi:hypothetical protein
MKVDSHQLAARIWLSDAIKLFYIDIYIARYITIHVQIENSAQIKPTSLREGLSLLHTLGFQIITYDLQLVQHAL